MAAKRFITGKYLQPLLHVVLWALVISSPYLFRNPNTNHGISHWQYKLIINNTLLALIFYFNAYLLYPKLYTQKTWLYILTVIITVGAALSINGIIEHALFPFGPPHGPGRFDGRPDGMHPRMDRGPFDKGFGWYFTNIITYVFIIGVSTSYRIITDNARQEKIRKEKENENLKTELSFLRSQVSPHFLFNILNNMVSLARKKSDILEPSLIELSKLMRYMLYENDDEKVSLAREIEYLKSYIYLQTLRFGDDVTIIFNPPENIDHFKIEPMLLTPFVENAFKHGVGMVTDPLINIQLNVNKETGWAHFAVMNSIAPQLDSKDKNSGIGLTNVQRRLELLYHDAYSLDISRNDKMFIVNLKIKLQ
ncbi:sensor histidine kinase [Mucilaginibacter sp. KACC 22063]|uniref:sensor histidine kinase n=1 Tax=Mucilaginibacter sp. KACC 22063 TaxID=3025666 RepID=UPI002366209F|nr:histidine kinase [Mucilaginibacter sp. KACC 22063]WDF55473.1 histidine kinase [Mucilaginibacter sp. KACC 22063]